MEYKEIGRELDHLKQKSVEMFESINIPVLKEKLSDLEQQSVQEGFWNDQERSAAVNKEISGLKKKIEPWEMLIREINDATELLEMAAVENDESIADEIVGVKEKLQKQFDDLETLELLSDEDDTKNAFLTIHAGAGGTESQDWANILLRMYLRWAEKQKFAVEYIDYNAGEEAGIKGATILLKGEYAYGLAKSEMGVHRLVRISPFDANKRRHTSFASVEVIAEVEDDIDIEINETELRIDTFRSSGSGGQHVNTTDSAVRITHLPSGIVVSCQNERSQHKNKAFAMKVLKSKLYERRKEEILALAEEKSSEKKDIAWGSQIRSYVYQPYTLVKDHRTGEETSSIEYVMDGALDKFIYAYLKMINKKR